MPREGRDHGPGDLLRPPDQLLVTESEHRPIHGREQSIPVSILSPLPSVHVELIAVSLDDDPPLDEEIDSSDPVKSGLGCRLQPEISDEQARKGLQTGFCARIGRSGDRTGARGVLTDRLEVCRREQAHVARAVHSRHRRMGRETSGGFEDRIDDVHGPETWGTDERFTMAAGRVGPSGSVLEMHVEFIAR
jgi:hypothetical protein